MARTGRPREFDESVAARELTRVFWEKGYHTTSIQDLVDATGVQRNSLYGVFGNKKALLLVALAQYRAQVTEVLERLQREAPVLPALRHFLTFPLDPSRALNGCLLGNTTVEVSGQDEDIHAAVRDNFAALERALRLALERAHRSGELPPRDAATQARMLMAVQQGLQVISRATDDPTRSAAAVDAVLDSLR
ncbi:TetR/AcrR family transcriptional regulator [Saccharothrix coeruleofusca]|uniref:TetR family transcriptional regulator n=1 Tax=Saccharothrix coeruleofusca TaxID=33919 RepID=A0A918ANM4_9PSEU|nr:TetR/AcrR family transcriptional regulator [Saccharothrix coeruleofusca]GGP65513.1 TetR family transcriptional regulator [Saccharothrix coeruleofusca]